MARKVASYAFIGFLASAVVAINIAVYPYSRSHPDSVLLVLFIAVMTSAMSIPDVRIDRGTLTLNGVISGAASILLDPLDATLVGLATSLPFARRGVWPMLGNAAIYATVLCLASLVSAYFRSGTGVAFGPRVATLLVLTGSDVVLVTTAISIRTGESGLSVLHRNFTAPFFFAFGYFGLSALLISYVLDGTVLGYFLATIVCVLALALTDTIAGRRVRRVLESELSDADRHLFHSRAVEVVVHNLRNHVATALGYLREIDTRRLDHVDRESFETATAAANDAVTVLRTLSQGATPRVTYAVEPVDLNELITRSLGMARPRARAKEVQLALRESPDEVRVRADPLLLREVITNLVNNAIDSVPANGHVELKAGRRGNGSPYFSVSDDGPGVSDDHRHHLFEPHFTTKEGGTGLGLFMSYGIGREHQGQLIYEGSRRGAVFTVTLPPFSG